MGEIKWIKLTTDIFDNQKIRQIEVLPDGDSIIVIWLKLLTLAGKINDNGQIYLTNEIPYTEEMLATAFNRNINTIRIALNTFEKFGMINRIDDILEISNWEKYQNIEGMDKVREQTRKRVADYRERQKQLALKECNVTVTQSNGIDIEEDKEIEKEEDKEKRKESRGQKSFSLNHSTQQRNTKVIDDVVNLYTELCTNLPKVRAITDKRKKAVIALLKMHDINEIKEVFKIANSSSFLTGDNDRGWKADFDFMMREDKFVAILEGKYNSKKKSAREKFGETDKEKFGYSRKEKLNVRKSF